MVRILIATAVLGVLFLAGCEAMKTPRPIMAQREYERLIVGRFDADYVGTDNCLRACHFHDKLRADFDASLMGAQMSRASGGGHLVDCESCHGPGSLAIAGLNAERVRADGLRGVQTKCDYSTLIDLRALPAPARSQVCLRCHAANATFNLHEWNTGAHAASDVSCPDCHNVHAGPDLVVRPRALFVMCYQCHQDVRAEFTLPSHHPVHEQAVVCSDCHASHGSSFGALLRREGVLATCVQCHPEKAGPFAFEHADLKEDCSQCHAPHGSVNDNLLKEREPFLCLQCHEGHRADTGQAGGPYYAACSSCHTGVHGSDAPSAKEPGALMQ